MMVPRSYALQKQTPGGESHMDEKCSGFGVSWKIPRTRSVPGLGSLRLSKKSPPTPLAERALPAVVSAPESRRGSAPVVTPSDPVVIPSRTGRSGTPSAETTRSRPRRREPLVKSYDDRHNPRAVPPSVAALLAVTSIPPPSARAVKQRSTLGRRPFQKTSIDELIQGWRDEESLSVSSSPGANWHMEILLDRCDETDAEHEPELSPSYTDHNDLDLASGLTSRSLSSDSIAHVPELLEDRSLASWDSITTPSVRNRKVSVDKVSSLVEDCPLDHPLITGVAEDNHDVAVQQVPILRKVSLSSPRPLSPPAKSKSSFKSNLTASINALASSLRSFSNFTAPSIPADDLLTRSILSTTTLPPPYTPEMRPKSSDGVPDPALRRYLNPTPRPERVRQQHQRRLSFDDREHMESTPSAGVSLDSGAGPAFAAASDLPHTQPDSAGPMIQMQTYGIRARTARSKRLPMQHLSTSSMAEVGESEESVPPVQSRLGQREPRENSDFLRVVVLEMNMRRAGKLDAKSALRARVWLPPRKSVATRPMADADGGSGEVVGDKRMVPARWTGMSVDD